MEKFVKKVSNFVAEEFDFDKLFLVKMSQSFSEWNQSFYNGNFFKLLYQTEFYLNYSKPKFKVQDWNKKLSC